MDGLNHKKLTVSAGHEGHGVHSCRRCGWRFPNPHPSARHRKSHKRVCGTIEGYEIIQSESDDYRLVVSSDGHWSDDNDGTLSPKVDKRYEKDFGGSGGVGEKSNPSDDEVFADAVTEFSDSGISPQKVECFEHFKGTEKSVELNTVEDDLRGTVINDVDETAGKAGELNFLRNTDPMCNPEALVNAAYQSNDFPLITGTRIEQVSITDSNVLQHALIETGFLKDASVATVNEFGDAERQQGLGMVGLDSDIQKENDRLASVTLDSVEGKPPIPVLTALGSEEVPCDDLASEVVKGDPSLTRMLENIDATAEVKTVANSNQVNGSTRTIGNNAVAEEIRENINDPVWITDESDPSLPSVSPSESKQTSAAIDVKVEQNTSLGNGENLCDSNPSAGEKCHTDENEDRNQEPIVKYSCETVSAHGCETTESLKEGMNHSNEEAESDISKPENVKCDRAATDIQEVHDSAQQLEERSKVETSSPESINNTSCPTLHEFRMGKVTEVLQELGSAKMDSGLDPVSSSVNFELPNNINETSNVKGIESGVTDSEILCECSANVSSGTGNGDITSESIDCAEVGSERNQNGSSELCADNSGSPTSIIHETFLLNQKYLNETLSDVDNGHANDGIANQTCDDDFVPSVLNSEVVHETSATQDDNGEDLSLDSKPLQEHGKVRLMKKNDGVSANDLSHRLIGRSDSLEGKCGSVSADMSEANLQEPKMTTVEARAKTSDVFELPPSMNSVHSGSVVDKLASASKIEKSDYESQDQKINVETIDNVTNWTPEKQQSQLKHLLSEAKSPNTKQATVKNNGNKEMEDWDSPIRYPGETKKRKKKGKPYWVPFVCCSSVHRDL